MAASRCAVTATFISVADGDALDGRGHGEEANRTCNPSGDKRQFLDPSQSNRVHSIDTLLSRPVFFFMISHFFWAPQLGAPKVSAGTENLKLRNH